MPASYTQTDGSVVPVELEAAFAAQVSASFTRPANTTAYAAGTLVANSTTLASVVPLVLPVARLTSGTGIIPRVALVKNNNSLTNASFRVHLYQFMPTSSAADGGAYMTDQALTELDYFDLTMQRAYADGARGWGAPSVGTSAIFDASAGSCNLYALVEARAAYTPASGEVFTVIVEALQN